MYTFKFNSLQSMDILLRIERAIIGQENLIALVLKTAIQNGTPAMEVIKMLKDMTTDNETAMQDVLGVALTHRIKLFV